MQNLFTAAHAFARKELRFYRSSGLVAPSYRSLIGAELARQWRYLRGRRELAAEAARIRALPLVEQQIIWKTAELSRIRDGYSNPMTPSFRREVIADIEGQIETLRRAA